MLALFGLTRRGLGGSALVPQGHSCDGGTVHNELLVLASTDHGGSWGAVVNVSAQLERQGLPANQSICLDPVTGAGGQLRTGPRKGRLRRGRNYIIRYNYAAHPVLIGVHNICT